MMAVVIKNRILKDVPVLFFAGSIIIVDRIVFHPYNTREFKTNTLD